MQERGCLVMIIYSTSIYWPAATGQAPLAQASFVLMTALGGGDNESDRFTVHLLCARHRLNLVYM